jgi:L-2-hydroxycarboxylate dehydrogenase (NAD+)
LKKMACQSADVGNASRRNVVVSAEEERSLITQALISLGAAPEEATIQADVLTEADLRGVHSHGLQRLPVIVKRIEKGLISVQMMPNRQWTASSVLSVDGRNGFGPFVAETSLRLAAEVAQRNGAVAVAIRNSSHIGMAGYYCERRAFEGLICIGFTTSEALVHPYGGAEAMIGTNPIAIAIPCQPRPFLLDMATSTSALGRIIALKQRGERLPDGWAIDRDGNPTNDPGAALGGSLTPAGGPKGYGLGVAIGAISGLLPGGEIGQAVRGTLDTDHRCTKGDLFLLLDPKAFAGGATLELCLGSYLQSLRHSKPQRGYSSVMVPGEMELSLREERLTNGIPLPEEVWHDAQQLHAALSG